MKKQAGDRRRRARRGSAALAGASLLALGGAWPVGTEVPGAGIAPAAGAVPLVSEERNRPRPRERQQDVLLTAYFIPFAVETYAAVTPERIRHSSRPIPVTSPAVAGEVSSLLPSGSRVTAPAAGSARFGRWKTRLLVEWHGSTAGAGQQRQRRIFVDQGGVAMDGRGSVVGVLPRSAMARLSEILSTEGARIEQAERAAHERARPALVRAVTSGDLARTERLLATGADSNARDSEDQDRITALMHAASDGRADLCALLLRHGAKLDVLDDNGYTALTYAAINGHQATFDLLAARGASARGRSGGQALRYAAGEGDEKMVQRLLALGADPNHRDARDESFTPLIAAALKGDAAVMTTLLDAGARVDGADEYERSPLTWACIGGDNATARLLLARGASVNRDDGIALLLAIRNGRSSTVRLLLAHRARVSAAHRAEAIEAGNKQIIVLLKAQR